MKDPILVDSLVIGRPENRIEKNFDGSMVFRDALVPGVRLVDLLDGNVVIDPGVYVVIESTDWILIDDLYTANITHNWNLQYPTMIDVLIYNSDYELITVDTVKVNTNYVTIKTTINQKMYVSLKKI